MTVLRLFGPAREAAGTASDEAHGATVRQALDHAVAIYGERFEEVLATSRVWLNGEEVAPDTPLGTADELAVLPPVSGG